MVLHLGLVYLIIILLKFKVSHALFQGDVVKRESGEIPEQYSITVKVTNAH